MSSKITVRPYLDPNNDNMGLINHSQTVFANVYHEEALTCLEQYGVRRYMNGLDEFAPEIDGILDPDLKKAKVLEIRKNVAFLEQRLGGQTIKVTDEDFWGKVKLMRSNNDDFFAQIKMICGNDPIYLDPAKDPLDLIKILAIEAGGFSIIAPSLEVARKMNKPPKFYLDKLEDTVSLTVNLKKRRNKAGALLEKLFDKDFNKLFYVAKVIDTNSVQYRKTTSKDVFYNNMDLFLDGKLDGNTHKGKNIDKFIETAELDMETLKLRSIIKDGNFLRLIATRGDGGIYDLKSGAMMGKTPTEVVEFLKNPLNDNILTELTGGVEASWGKI